MGDASGWGQPAEQRPAQGWGQQPRQPALAPGVDEAQPPDPPGRSGLPLWRRRLVLVPAALVVGLVVGGVLGNSGADEAERGSKRLRGARATLRILLLAGSKSAASNPAPRTRS